VHSVAGLVGGVKWEEGGSETEGESAESLGQKSESTKAALAA
jgi:hypothetical protein